MNRSARPARRILMTCDAVGGVWRYALDLAATLKREGTETVLAVLGPAPTPQQREEARSAADLVMLEAPLDWMVDAADDVADVPRCLADLARERDVDLLHLNLPSQAAGLETERPVLVVSHSCTVTWFAAVRGGSVPPDWAWQERLNRLGFARADAVVAPSKSHAALLQQVYGSLPAISVIPNGSSVEPEEEPKDRCVFAAGRWWDGGKNAAVLDRAAPLLRWPLVMAGAATGPNGQSVGIRNASSRGNLPHRETMALMRRSSLFVSPSLYEPFGLAALEAARAGCALVLADIPTYRELWSGAALFFRPRDPDDLARAVNMATVDERLRAQLSRSARQRSANYSLEAQGRDFSTLYDAICEGGHTAFMAAGSV